LSKKYIALKMLKIPILDLIIRELRWDHRGAFRVCGYNIKFQNMENERNISVFFWITGAHKKRKINPLVIYCYLRHNMQFITTYSYKWRWLKKVISKFWLPKLQLNISNHIIKLKRGSGKSNFLALIRSF